MNRPLHFLAGPEAVLALLTALVFLVCARHSSYSAADVRVLERMMWLLPVVAVPLAYATLLVPGAKSWWWIGRINLAVLVCLTVGALRVVEGFGAPGSGPKGQDAGFIIVISLGVILSALGNAVAGALVLRAENPSFAEWFRLRPVLAPALTVLAAVPLAAAQTVATGLVLGIAGAVYSAFSR